MPLPFQKSASTWVPASAKLGTIVLIELVHEGTLFALLHRACVFNRLPETFPRPLHRTCSARVPSDEGNLSCLSRKEKRGKKRLKIIFLWRYSTISQKKKQPQDGAGRIMQIQCLLCKTSKSKSFCKAGTFVWRLPLLLFLCCFLLLRSSFLSLWDCFLFGSSFLSFLFWHNSLYQILLKYTLGWLDFLYCTIVILFIHFSITNACCPPFLQCFSPAAQKL